MNKTKQRPFIDTLRDAERGRFLDSLTDEQSKLIEAIKLTGKKGKIVITLEYVPDGEHQVTMKSSFATTVPKASRASTTFFVTDENTLQREDPRQQSMELREVKAPGEGEKLREVQS